MSLGILVALTLADLAGDTSVDYAGIYTCLPFLTAVFAAPRFVALVGASALGLAYFQGVYQGVSDEGPQQVRLLAIVLATAAAMAAAHLRERRDKRLANMTGVAEATQLALLRPVPDHVDGLDVAVRYFSAAEGSRIGGDLYDVTSTPWGVRILLGDVRGKGLEAVGVTADILGAFRHLAQTEEDPLAVVQGLDSAASRAGGVEDFVTAIVAEYTSTSLRLYNCGHPSPLLVENAQVRELDPGSFSPPLGLGAAPDVLELQIVPGQEILLYTDGLTEARNDNGDFFPLLSRARLLTGIPEEDLNALSTALLEHVGGKLGDDAALLAFTPSAHPPAQS